jgi:hypothetical protein
MATAKEHWENVYTTKQPHEVSWTQDVPQPSLDFIHDLQLPKTAGIIDVGGGDSKLVDFLLAEGFVFTFSQRRNKLTNTLPCCSNMLSREDMRS